MISEELFPVEERKHAQVFIERVDSGKISTFVGINKYLKAIYALEQLEAMYEAKQPVESDKSPAFTTQRQIDLALAKFKCHGFDHPIAEISHLVGIENGEGVLLVRPYYDDITCEWLYLGVDFNNLTIRLLESKLPRFMKKDCEKLREKIFRTPYAVIPIDSEQEMLKALDSWSQLFYPQ